MKKLIQQFKSDGYVISHSEIIKEKVLELKDLFESKFHSRFCADPITNRNLIKRFADSIEMAQLFASIELQDLIRAVGVCSPVYCGPLVSHYTHSDLTGSSYGLPWHQDYPSMASSSNAVIVWISVNVCSSSTHSLEVVPMPYKSGLLPGVQKEDGYILNQKNFEDSLVLDVVPGDVILFSPFLPHRTFMNPNSSTYKLSFSRRFDDLDCPIWSQKKYANAYGVTVDRLLYSKSEVGS